MSQELEQNAFDFVQIHSVMAESRAVGVLELAGRVSDSDAAVLRIGVHTGNSHIGIAGGSHLGKRVKRQDIAAAHNKADLVEKNFLGELAVGLGDIVHIVVADLEGIAVHTAAPAGSCTAEVVHPR